MVGWLEDKQQQQQEPSSKRVVLLSFSLICSWRVLLSVDTRELLDLCSPPSLLQTITYPLVFIHSFNLPPKCCHDNNLHDHTNNGYTPHNKYHRVSLKYSLPLELLDQTDWMGTDDVVSLA